MGFMAGFGSAFSRGMERNQELREKRKDDIFKMTFDEYAKRDEEYRKQVKADEADARKAKSLAEMKDPALMPKVLEWVKGGMSEQQIIENLQTGTFDIAKAPAKAGSATANTAAADSGAGKPQGQGKPGEVRKGSDGKSYQYAETTGMAGASGPQGWIEVNAATNNAAQPAPDSSGQFEDEGKDEDAMGQQMEQSGLQTRQRATPGDKVVSDPRQKNDHGGFLSSLSGKFKGPSQGGILADTFGNDSRSMGRFANKARSQVAQISGRSPEEMDKIMSGNTGTAPDASGITFTPAGPAIKADPINTLNEAALERDAAMKSGDPNRIAAAEQRVKTLTELANKQAEREAAAKGNNGKIAGNVVRLIKDGKELGQRRIVDTPQGQMLLDPMTNKTTPMDDPEVQQIPVTQEERQAMDKIDAEIGKGIHDVEIKKNAFKSATRLYGEMDDLVEAYGDVILQPFTTQMAQAGQRLSTEVTAAQNLIQGIQADIGNPQDPGTVQKNVAALEGQVGALTKSLAGPGTRLDKVATARTLLETKQMIMAYQIGAMMGQDGRSLQENERKNFMQMAAGGTTKTKFQKGMSDFLKGQMLNIDEEEKSVYDSSPTLRRFESKGQGGWGYRPDSYVPNPISQEMDGYVKSAQDTNNPSQSESTLGLAKGFSAIQKGSSLPIQASDTVAQKLGVGGSGQVIDPTQPRGPQAASQQPAPQQQPKYPEGTVISNGQQRMIRQGNKWVPLQQ